MDVIEIFENTKSKLDEVRKTIEKVTSSEEKNETDVQELAGASRDLVVIAYIVMPVVEKSIEKAKEEKDFDLFEKSKELEMLYTEVKLEMEYLIA